MTPTIAQLIRELEETWQKFEMHMNKPISEFKGRELRQDMAWGFSGAWRVIEALIPERKLVSDLFEAGWNCTQSDGDDEVPCQNFTALIEELSEIAATADLYIDQSDTRGLLYLSDLGTIEVNEMTCLEESGVTTEIEVLIYKVYAWVEYQKRYALKYREQLWVEDDNVQRH